MINVQTLGMLLRTLQTGDVSPRALAPLQPLAPAQSVKPVSSEDSQARQSAAREQTHLPTPARETIVGGRILAPSAGATLSPLPAPNETAASLRLSTAAMAIDQLVRRPGGEPIRPPGPLIPAPQGSDAPEAIARALQRSIATSGVFYESHLVEWTLQRHSVANLQREPQAAWPSAGTGTTAAAPTAALPLEGATAVPTAFAQPTPPTLAPLPDTAPALVRQQLDVLETGQILWRGDLWPGQPASIEITEDEDTREPGMAPVWRTRLALALPGLGDIEARLALSGHRLQLHIDTRDPASVPWLREALPALVAALSARALEVAPVVIRDEPER